MDPRKMATVAAKFFHFSKSSDKNRKSNQRTHSKTHEQCLFKNWTTRHVCKPQNANGCRPTTTSHKTCMMLIGRKNTAAVRQPLTDLTTEPLYQSEPSGKDMPVWSSQCCGRAERGGGRPGSTNNTEQNKDKRTRIQTREYLQARKLQKANHHIFNIT